MESTGMSDAAPTPRDRTSAMHPPSESIPSSTRDKRTRSADEAWFLLALVALVIVILGKDLTVGGLRSMDSPVHAMDGVLIHDWVAAGPGAWVDPMAFALDQYGHYPSLSIGRHYPPGFAVVEAGFFALFGISAASARLCVVFFGILGVSGVYVFTRALAGRWISLLAGVLFLVMPAVTLWGRQTMLELPTLAVLAWGAVAFTHYIRRPNAPRLLVLITAALLAPLFKQNGVFLIGAIATAIAYGAISGRAPWRHAVIAAIAALLAAAAVVWSLDEAGSALVTGYENSGDPGGWAGLTYYALHLPGEAGWIVIVAALVGLTATLFGCTPQAALLVAWFLLSYAMVTLAGYKSPRLFIVGLFPVAVWGAIGMERALSIVPYRAMRAAIVIATAAALLVSAFEQEIRHYPDQGPIVAANRDRIQGRAVLFSGLRDGDFVFAVRQHVPWRETVVVRASKLLYSCIAHPNIEHQSFADSAAQVGAMLDGYALPYLFVERKNRIQVREDELLRDYLATTDDYRRVAEHPLPAEEEPGYRDVTLDVYERSSTAPRTERYIDVSISRIGRSVRIDLEHPTG